MYVDYSNLKPKEEGNAQHINEVCLPIQPFTLLRYEAIAEHYTSEPNHINIRLKENEDYNNFEQVLRLRTWVPNQEICSWCIYSEDREWSSEENTIGGLVIRNVIWERKKDLLEVKALPENERGRLLNDWPTLKIRNLYFNSDSTSELIATLRDLDKFLGKGIKMKRRNKAEKQPFWSDLEVMRLFDWGQVHTVWSSHMINRDIEDFVDILNIQLERYTKNFSENIYQMDLDYSCPPELLKGLSQGSFQLKG